MNMNWDTGLIGATITVLITTLDDSVWLVSFVGTPSVPIQVRIAHAITFILTLEVLSIFCCLVAIGIQAGVFVTIRDPELLEIKLEGIAVFICWLLALGFCLRKKVCRKRHRRSRDGTEQQQHGINIVEEDGSSRDGNRTITRYGAISQNDDDARVGDGDGSDDGNNENVVNRRRSSIPTTNSEKAQPWTVITLTAIGFLDEISYFPAVILGNIFDIYQLCLGTLFAAFIMVMIQAILSNNYCIQPIIKFLDNHIPLYGIISIFATILTVHLIIDIVSKV